MTVESIKRVVVRPPNWLGDAVMALPALAALRRHFVSSHLTIAAVPAVAALFREETDARPDSVIDLPVGHRAAVAALEGGGFDAGILFPNSFRSAWQFRSAAIPERWGYARSGRGLLLTRKSRPEKLHGGGVVHQADYYRRLVAGLGIDCPPDEAPRITARHPSAERARALLTQHGVDRASTVVGLAPGAAYGQAKQWPPDRMAAVAAEVVRQHRATTRCAGVNAGS